MEFFRRSKKLIRWLPFPAAFGVFLVNRFAGSSMPVFEQVYAQKIYPVITFSMTALFDWVPLSLTELALVLLLFGFLASASLVLRKRLRLRKWLFGVFSFVSLLYAWFYISWGFNYLRQPLLVRTTLQPVSVDSTRFREILQYVLDDANQSYVPVQKVDRDVIDAAIEKGFVRVARLLGTKFPDGFRKPKALLANFIINKTLTNGFFSPFFHEIHVNTDLLSVEYPFTLAHEKSHQMGIASEAEANFIAYLVCLESGDAAVQYSAKLDILGEFLRRGRFAFADYPALRGQVREEIEQDFVRIRQRWLQHAGAISEVSSEAYDRYLKANRIPDGLANYNGVVEMVLSWYANKPGEPASTGGAAKGGAGRPRN